MKLMEKAVMILHKKGRFAVELARRRVLEEQVEYEPLRNALHYFIGDWNDFLHPALVSLACEAVGGKPETTATFGAALVLLAGGADIHDDIIDRSVTKGSDQTVFGKYGADLAILTGDALLLEGIFMLHEACEKLETTKAKNILNMMKRAFFDISGAEAAEAGMRGRIDIEQQQYLKIIRHKIAAGEVAMRIGAIVGGGAPQEVETLAEYGRIYGILMSIRDEFVDMFEQEELSNRVEKEVLPLPIIVTLADESKKLRLLHLMKGDRTDAQIEEIVDIVTNSEESKRLVSEMRGLANQIVQDIQFLRYSKDNLKLIVEATLEDL